MKNLKYCSIFKFNDLSELDSLFLNDLFQKYSFHDRLLSLRSDDYKLTADELI